jgi:VanZ family protein
MSMRLAWLNVHSGVRWFLTMAVWAMVNVMLFLPAKKLPDMQIVFMQDKIVHLVIFALLAAMVRWALPDQWGNGWRGIAVVVVLIVHGLATECLQSLLPSAGRAFEWADLAMDWMGTVTGRWICGWLAVRQ